MDPALIGAIAEAITAQYKYMEVVFNGAVHVLDTAIIEPKRLQQQAYLDRLKKALEFTDQYAGLYNEQINAQRTLMYGIMAIIALIIIASIFKK
jgi:hypothetical protein